MAYDASITFEGALWDSKRRITEAEKIAAQTARVYGLELLKTRTPVLTGRMKASWEAALTNKGITWSNSAPYAAYVELGTRYMKPRNVLTGALPAIEDKYLETLAKQVGYKLANQALEALARVNDLPQYSNVAKKSRPSKPIKGFVPRRK